MAKIGIWWQKNQTLQTLPTKKNRYINPISPENWEIMYLLNSVSMLFQFSLLNHTDVFIFDFLYSLKLAFFHFFGGGGGMAWNSNFSNFWEKNIFFSADVFSKNYPSRLFLNTIIVMSLIYDMQIQHVRKYKIFEVTKVSCSVIIFPSVSRIKLISNVL